VNTEQTLTAMRDVIQRDVGNRGLARDPHDNLLTACPDDFAAACKSIADTAAPGLLVFTGFHIATAEPPCHETDGPLGALFLARAFRPLGIDIHLLADGTSVPALRSGLATCGLKGLVSVFELPEVLAAGKFGYVTHLLAIERVGPGHTAESLRARAGTSADDLATFEREVPAPDRGRCRSMRGRDLTAMTRPAHLYFESQTRCTTIGIGDGGNEIGMGKIPWRTIRNNIPNGGLIACRVPTDHLIVAGVSNWGAYALAAGVALLRGQPLPDEMFDVEREREILRVMVEQGPLVDGVTAKPTVSVDGLSFDEYARPLVELAKLR
jgi:hypothetical protein